jgi:hypothetical protein
VLGRHGRARHRHQLCVFGGRKSLLRGVRSILRWLEQCDGDTWEERWLASGADTAPRSWREVVRPGRLVTDVAVAANALMVARVPRPSYGWQLAAHAGAHLPDRMLSVNDPDAVRQLRALPAYQRALLRHRVDAEACLSRELIRTGRRLEQLEGEHLLHYADVVKTSGRHAASTWPGS